MPRLSASIERRRGIGCVTGPSQVGGAFLVSFFFIYFLIVCARRSLQIDAAAFERGDPSHPLPPPLHPPPARSLIDGSFIERRNRCSNRLERFRCFSKAFPVAMLRVGNMTSVCYERVLGLYRVPSVLFFFLSNFTEFYSGSCFDERVGEWKSQVLPRRPMTQHSVDGFSIFDLRFLFWVAFFVWFFVLFFFCNGDVERKERGSNS